MGMFDSKIKIHTAKEDFDGMRKAGRLAAETLDYITPFVKPDVTTEELDRLCAEYIKDHGAIAAPLNYRGFPKSICTSINHVICHGIPNDRQLKDGDIINIDVTVIVNGWHGDTSRMFFVGDKISVKAKKLVKITYEATMLGIAQVKDGCTLGDIGHAMQTHAERNRFSVVEAFCGHGIGQTFHTPPSVLNYGKPNKGTVLKSGTFITIEPMINIGKKDEKILSDGWTAVTRDKSLSAQFEHTLAITKDGFEIFTKSPKGWDNPWHYRDDLKYS